jgi:hypothetical protein
MANFELKFFDGSGSHIKVNAENTLPDFDKSKIDFKDQRIIIKGYCVDSNSTFSLWLDKSTSIKFAKTLRTEINKIQS